MTDWKWPLSFLDFETINPALPQHEGCSPYSHIPFQFSLHILKNFESEIEHHHYLHQDSSDPRPLLLKKLLETVPEKGSIVAYYSKFESDRLQDLELAFPQFADQLRNIRERLVDPLPLIRDYLYHPQFKSSFSLKSVAPALLGESQLSAS